LEGDVIVDNCFAYRRLEVEYMVTPQNFMHKKK